MQAYLRKYAGLFKSIATLALALGLGFAGGYTAGKGSVLHSIGQAFMPIEEKGTSYTFVHPLLAFRTPEATVLGDYTSLKSAFNSIASSVGHSGGQVSIYFRDLDAGQWVGVNQDVTYYPASLLKVPTMIALYKEAETDPSVFAEKIAYEPSVLPNDPFEAPSTLLPSQVYSLQELIKYMITDSDNGATFTLLNRLNPDFLHAVYIALGIQDPGDNSAQYKISARTYGLFFRVLYNASYLSSDVSEKALRLLSESTYADGLVAGVPKGTVIAHKYGEHILSMNGAATGVELSDCGIVYYPAHPYLLCVMTSSPGIATGAGIIAKVSNTAYAAVAEEYAVSTGH